MRWTRRSALWVSLLGSTAFFGGGCGGPTGAADAQPGTSKQAGGEAAENPEGNVPRVLVRLGEFQRGDVSSRLPAPANLEAIQEADVYPEVPGVIREVHLEEGAPVRQDETVVVLQDDQLRLTHENKVILLEQARTKRDQATLALQEGQAIVQQKTLLLEQADKEFQRILALSSEDEGIISPEEADAKRYGKEQARIDKLTAGIQASKYELAVTEAEQALKLADVELRTAAYNLSRTKISSPIDGFISYLDLKRGETVQQSTLVFSVVSLERLRARLFIPQRELRRLTEGQQVRVTCEVYPGNEFWGEVAVINPVVDKDSGTVRVTVEVRDPSRLLKPGMFIDAEIILDTHENAWLVPKKAVVYESQQPVIFMVVGDRAKRLVVTPGYSTKEHLEVLELVDGSGNRLSPDRGRLVMVGQNNLKDGSLVEIE